MHYRLLLIESLHHSQYAMQHRDGRRQLKGGLFPEPRIALFHSWSDLRGADAYVTLMYCDKWKAKGVERRGQWSVISQLISLLYLSDAFLMPFGRIEAKLPANFHKSFVYMCYLWCVNALIGALGFGSLLDTSFTVFQSAISRSFSCEVVVLFSSRFLILVYSFFIKPRRYSINLQYIFFLVNHPFTR